MGSLGGAEFVQIGLNLFFLESAFRNQSKADMYLVAIFGNFNECGNVEKNPTFPFS